MENVLLGDIKVSLSQAIKETILGKPKIKIPMVVHKVTKKINGAFEQKSLRRKAVSSKVS